VVAPIHPKAMPVILTTSAMSGCARLHEAMSMLKIAMRGADKEDRAAA
jgi:hypothetical protein